MPVVLLQEKTCLSCLGNIRRRQSRLALLEKVIDMLPTYTSTRSAACLLARHRVEELAVVVLLVQEENCQTLVSLQVKLFDHSRRFSLRHLQ